MSIKEVQINGKSVNEYVNIKHQMVTLLEMNYN